MKKIAIAASLTLFTGLAIAGAKSGFVLSGEGSYSSISGTSSISESGGGDDWSISTKRGPSFGLGAYLGYDYALTEHLAVGIKTGYFNSFGLGKIDYSGQIGGTDITSSQTFKSSNIPVLFGAKYYFDSGLYVGGEIGVNFQKLSVTADEKFSANHVDYLNPANIHRSWNAQAVIGALVGYDFYTNLSISGSIQYFSGSNLNLNHNNTLSPAIYDTGALLENKPLVNMKLGVQINYLLPI